MIKITAEEIAQRYSAAMDSVNLIAELQAKSKLTECESNRVARNQDHLEIMLNKKYWTTEDLTPFSDAIK